MEKLDIQYVENYFGKKGYVLSNLHQPWRHLVGKAVIDSKTYFLKLAAFPEVSPLTENEFSWNNFINSEVNDFPVKVPKVYNSGKLDQLFWYIGEYVEGHELVKVENKDDVQLLITNLGKIALTAEKIIKMDTIPDEFTKGNEDINEITLSQKILEKVKEWSTKTSTNTTNLIEYIESYINHVQIAPIHSDFVPWHFIITKNNSLYLIDGERARLKGIKFYDVAYFYHRVYTKLKRPDIADKFLDEFRQVYKFLDEDNYCFKLILAQRIVGGYMDAESDNITSLKLQKELEKRLLNGKI